MRTPPRVDPGPVPEVIDYLLVLYTGRDRPAGQEPAGAKGPLDLGHGVVVRRLDSGVAERLLAATRTRGENFDPPLLYRAAHAFTRAPSVEEFALDLYGWDPTGALFNTLWLSRLIHDNAATTEFAVRRIMPSGDRETLVPVDTYDSHVAYKVDPGDRDWLVDEEVVGLAALLEASRSRPLPDRVARALRYSELATRERFLEDAQPLIVRGLEALLKVGRTRLQRQFSQRTTQLATEPRIEIDLERCSDAYDDRSALVHGAHVDLRKPVEQDAFINTMVSMQRVLRAAGRRAIEDQQFAEVFADDKSIVARWPATYSETF